MSYDIHLMENDVYVNDNDCLNVTYNLGKMGRKAGWWPKNVNGSKAIDNILPLKLAIVRLQLYPKYYEQFDAENGWGVRKHLLKFYQNVLKECQNHLNATLIVY